jgi:hypothetical protein
MGSSNWFCHSPLLQRFVLHTHERALAKALSNFAEPRRVIVIGGGLFPRTALILQRLVPAAELILIDARADRLERANTWLHGRVECVHAFCTAANVTELIESPDLVVVPLAFRGRRNEIYENPPAPNVLVHDWLWQPRGRSVVVSWILLKRINLITARSPNA